MDFFIKCDQIHSFLQIWSHLLKKSLMENFIFCALYVGETPSETCSGDIENDQEMIKSIMKRQIFFSQLSFRMLFLFCFVFEKMSSSLPMLLVMLFAHVGKRSNSRSKMLFLSKQMFLNILQYSQENTCAEASF